MFQSIRGRILSTNLFLILTAMIVLGIALIWPLQNYFLSNLKDDMVNRSQLVSRLLEQEVINGNYSNVDKQAKLIGEKINTRITIILPDGKVIADSESNPQDMDNHSNRPEIKKAFSGEVASRSRYSTTLDTEMMYVALPIKKDGEIVAVTRLALPLTEIAKIFFRLRTILITGILIAAAIAIFLSIKLTRGLTEPIEAISDGTRKIAAGNLETKVYSGTNDEIGELGKYINIMTATLREKIDEISQQKSRLENILNTMVSGVIVLDYHGMVKIINPAAEEIFGISGLISEGKHNLEVIRHYGLNEKIKQCLKEEKTIDYEFTIFHPEEKILQCYLAPVYRDKEIAGATLVFHDITTLRRLEKMRADFVANASHELRTPLTAIKGYAETLLDGALEDEKISRKFVTIINKEADRLMKLVEELLTLSRVESNGSEINLESVDIRAVIKAVSEEMKQRFSDKNISLSLGLPEKLAAVKANSNRIKQVMVNLLDNALKYTPEGGSVTVRAYEEDEDVMISVKDTGIGIPPKDIPRLFERFYRVDKGRSRQLGGFGLGLSIVKHIVHSFGGEIGVESTVNEGSTFWFRLPKYSK
ncbi:MAG: two-component system, OmpR family, phosphate regulon sensor histidine kinase PhoR [Clostridia bacterium]|nr:phoR [Clostridiales bacterium]MDK2985804.1 two-component system, OmpR family, phosphate regulon sensor histidine kinase PhoR [Clostridia bacterium]